MVVGFGLALLLNQKLRGTYFFRVGIFQIWVIPWISVAILWGWIFNSDYGVVNFLLMDLGLLENKVNWLASEVLARLVIILGFAWRMIPFMMVISAFTSPRTWSLSEVITFRSRISTGL